MKQRGAVIWDLLPGVVAGIEAIRLGSRGVRSLRKRLQGTDVAAAYQEAWTVRGGGPHDVARVVERGPWDVGDLASIMGVATDDEARAILELFGCVPDADGRYELGADLESRILRLAEDDAFRFFPDVTPTEMEVTARLLAGLQDLLVDTQQS